MVPEQGEEESDDQRALTQAERRELLQILAENRWRTSDDEDREGAGPYLELPPDD